jgi:hypothetical protein
LAEENTHFLGSEKQKISLQSQKTEFGLQNREINFI